MAEDLYGLIEKNKISGLGLQTLFLENKNQTLNARLYNREGQLIADSVE